MKFFYILANQFVTILLSANTVTSIHFNEAIQNCDYGANEKALAHVYRRRRTSLSLIPKVENINTNMTCYMESGKIRVFNIKWSQKNAHKNIAIFEAESKKGGVMVLETATFKLFDAGKNYYIESKKKGKINVNETVIEKAGVVSKWLPITVDGKEYSL